MLLLAFSILIVILSGIFLRYRSKRELGLRSDSLYQTFFELCSHPSAIVDPATGNFVKVNQALCKKLGFSENELLRMSFQDVTHPNDQKRSGDAFLEMRTRPTSQWELKKRYVQKDGHSFLATFNGTMVKDQQGQPQLVLAIVQDISEQERFEAALKQSEKKFRTFANFLPQMAWINDAQGTITWYNKRWYDYTGKSEQHLRREGWSHIHHPDYKDHVEKKWFEHLHSEKPWEDRFPLRCKDGNFRWFLSRAIPIRDERGVLECWVGTNTDITDQLLHETRLQDGKNEAERVSAAKTQFLANMSHEIRTPINAIVGFTEFLQDPQLSEYDRQRFTSVIERNSKHLLRLIDEILDLSKVESGHINIESERFSLIDFFAEINPVLQLRARKQNVEFEFEVEGKLPANIASDQTRLRQIVLNLCGNALKFTHTGRVSLRVSFEKPMLKILVSDTGIGIAKHNQHRLFTAFEQADASMTRKYGGSGLGLVLAKRLAEAMHGDVRLLRSELGRGSTFAASIRPDKTFDDAEVDQASFGVVPTIIATPERLDGLRILLADDSADNVTLVETYLKDTGAEIIVAENGQQAVSKALAEHPDLILMDIQMPLMDGHAAIRALRAEHFEKPIIAVTAHAMREERERCEMSGCTDYLTKPLKRATLIRALLRNRSWLHVPNLAPV